MDIVYFEGVKAKVRQTNFIYAAITVLAMAVILFTGCDSGGAKGADGEIAATVNGRPIKMEEVERIIKRQGQGQEKKLSQLELAQARLQALDSLVQQEVMFQKAEKEGTVPKDDEVQQEYNKQKTQSGLSAEEFAKKLTEIGETDQSATESIKKSLAIQKLIEKVTSKVTPPKDSEIEAFYTGNKSAFVKKRGVRLAAIVIDPADNGQGDTTKSEADAIVKAKEVAQKLAGGADFATVAREVSEDASKMQGGDMGYISEEELKQNYPQLAGGFMNPQFAIGQVTNPIPVSGKFYMFKLQERVEKEENLTLESPGVRQQITDSLTNARKNLASQSYAAIAMNEARIENMLAKKVVENPNELSGARPADAGASPAAAANANTAAANSNSNAAANSGQKANANAKAETKPSTPAANAASSNTNAGK